MRQRNSKSSAAAGRGYDIDLAVMCLDDFLSDSQAETCTICFVRGKRSKERFKRFGCHAAAIVRNPDNDMIQIFSGGKGYASVLPCSFEGVFEKIQKCLF